MIPLSNREWGAWPKWIFPHRIKVNRVEESFLVIRFSPVCRGVKASRFPWSSVHWLRPGPSPAASQGRPVPWPPPRPASFTSPPLAHALFPVFRSKGSQVKPPATLCVADSLAPCPPVRRKSCLLSLRECWKLSRDQKACSDLADCSSSGLNHCGPLPSSSRPLLC